MARDEVTKGLLTRLKIKEVSELLEYLGVDLRGIGPIFVGGQASQLCYADPTIEVTTDGIYRDIWRVGFKANQVASGLYLDLAESPLAMVSDRKEIESFSWPTAELWDYSHVLAECQQYHDYWVWAHSRGIFEISWFLRGFENFMLDLMTEPVLADAVMDHVESYLYERTHKLLKAGEGKIDMMEYNDDVGSQKGMLISPDLWRKRLKPKMRRFIEICRSYGARVRYHSCGSIRPIIPDLIEIGVDVLNPIQIAAADMDLISLKREFGRDITFDGGIDTEHLLPKSSADEVRRHVKHLIRKIANDGGYILSPSHVFQTDIPMDNILAMYEAAVPEK